MKANDEPLPPGPDVMVISQGGVPASPYEVIATYRTVHLETLEVHIPGPRPNLAHCAQWLRDVADKLENLHAEYDRQRAGRVRRMRSTVKDLVKVLQDAEHQDGDAQEVRRAFEQACSTQTWAEDLPF
ncbi:MAG TPA: hypothetical protein VN845_04725 [Solirubrobacteraceae bacterium]|nr:hypothetical protein [Solirubrobacteraceae bacterium]